MTDPQAAGAPTPEDTYDITFIGGGPTGMFGAFYAGLRELKTKVIEALPELGGQVAVLYPEKYIFDVAGFPKILARDLVKNQVEQMNAYPVTTCLEERVLDVKPAGEKLVRISTTKGVHWSKTVIIAAGVGAFSPNKLGNASIDRYEGRGVYYFVQGTAEFAGKDLVVVGGGDSAMDWVMNLLPLAKSITLVHRRDVFRAHESSVKTVFGLGIPIHLFCEIKELRGNGRVEQAVIFNNKTKEETTIPCDALLINVGFKADLGPIKDWGLEIDGRFIRVNGRMETNLPGIYCAGDLANNPNSVKLNLIVMGYAEAALAVNVAANYINPKWSIFPGHSSEKSS